MILWSDTSYQISFEENNGKGGAVIKSIKLMLLGIAIILFPITYAALANSFHIGNFLINVATYAPPAGLLVCVVAFFMSDGSKKEQSINQNNQEEHK